MEIRDHDNSVRNSDLVQILSKAANTGKFSVLFDSPNEFKGDHWAPKGPQRAPKVTSKWPQILPNCILAPAAVIKDLRGYPPWAKKAPKWPKLDPKLKRFSVQVWNPVNLLMTKIPTNQYTFGCCTSKTSWHGGGLVAVRLQIYIHTNDHIVVCIVEYIKFHSNIKRLTARNSKV